MIDAGKTMCSKGNIAYAILGIEKQSLYEATIEQIEKFVMNRKNLHYNDKISIIKFGREAKILTENVDLRSFDSSHYKLGF